MYMHSLQYLHNLHVFERGRKAIEQHAAMMLVLVIVIMLGIGYALNNQSSRAGVFQLSDVSEVGIRLSRFVDPQYANETETREQMIRTALAGLRIDLQADRAYIAIYDLVEEFRIEYQVISVLEATKTGVAPGLQRLQGLGRSSWLQMEDNAYRMNWLFTENATRIYGMELHDEQGTPIGYLGIEKIQETMFAEQNIQLLRETASSIEAVMLQSLEHVNYLKEL